MPGVSGFDVVDRLSEEGIIKNQKIVLFTATAVTEKELEHLIDLGAHSTLQKPVDVDTLLDKIEEVASS